MRLRRRFYACASTAVLAACGADSPLTPAAPVTPGIDASFIETSTSPIPLTPLVELNVPTYEGSGQAVHPGVVRFPSAWHGWEYWMVMTPFPLGHEAYENPSIIVSHDGLQWQDPDGLTRPLVRTPGKLGYNSDPDISYDAVHDRLIVLYREVTATQNLIWSTMSTDGVHWTKHILVFARPNHDIVSPTMTFGAAGTPMVWYVDAGPKNCSERVTHVELQTAASVAAVSPAAAELGWSTASHHVLAQPGMNIWHLDVTWVPERQEYWATYVAYPVHHCSGQDLFFARSSDGYSWTTYKIPFLRREETSWTTNTLYRAAVLYDASRDAIQFFVSATSADKTWHLGYVDYSVNSFLASLEHGSPVLVPASSRAPQQVPTSEP